MTKTKPPELHAGALHGAVTANPWAALRRFTDARIALGRAGVSQPTAAHLEFQMAHARARDAVHLALDTQALAPALDAALPGPRQGALQLHSAAANRLQYLQRPDLGRRLSATSRQQLEALYKPVSADTGRAYDLAFVIADGLSAHAIEQNAAPFLRALQPHMEQSNWRIAPLCVVQQGRVAIGDETGELLGAKAVVVLIGERPGLSSPDSMGLYLTWMPRLGLSDASRNCISNVRPAGLSYADAAFKLNYLLTQAHARQLSGVALKEEAAVEVLLVEGKSQGNFLLG
jgi:ethanolamine ammonia-lyase small subunit